MKKEVIPPAQTFKEILEENKASIYRICSIYAVAPVEPQDLFQEVVYHLWKSLPSFQGKSKGQYLGVSGGAKCLLSRQIEI